MPSTLWQNNYYYGSYLQLTQLSTNIFFLHLNFPDTWMKFVCIGTQPPKVVCKMEVQSEYFHITYTFLHIWRWCVSSVGVYQKNSSSDLRRKFIKGALLVGKKKKERERDDSGQLFYSTLPEGQLPLCKNCWAFSKRHLRLKREGKKHRETSRTRKKIVSIFLKKDPF